jgi:Leucine-rich repeat (LRR) protein
MRIIPDVWNYEVMQYINLETLYKLLFVSKLINISCSKKPVNILIDITPKSRNHYQYIPKNVRIKSLDLRSYRPGATKVRDHHLKHLTGLLELELYKNQTITDNSVKHLINLEHLTIGTPIYTITDESVKHLKNLKILILANSNNISHQMTDYLRNKGVRIQY